jgi:ABC-type branched-subunit amino acid transport system substrate-binding protein
MNRSTRIRPTRIVGVAIATTSVLALAACGGVNSASSDSSDAGSSGANTSASCKDTTGITDSTIKLGVLSDLSGPVAAGGVPFADGVKAYFNYANEKLDDLGGRKVELVVKDHQYNPQKAIQSYRELEGEVAGIPLSFGSAATAAVSAQIAKDCMPLVANAGSQLDQKKDVYYVGSTYEDNALNAIEYYVKDQNHPGAKVALFYQADSYGEGALKALQFAQKKLGFELVASQSYAPTDKSFSGQLSSIKAAKPDVVIMASTVGPTFGFYGEAQSTGASWDWVGLQPTFTPAVLKLPIADSYVKDFTIVYGAPVVETGGEQLDLATAQLTKDFPKDVDNPPALIGWQAGYIYYQALVAAQKSGTLDRGAIQKALSTLDVPSEGLGPKQLTFSPDSLTPGVPYHDDQVVTVDPSAKGLLKIQKPWFTSDLVDEYYESK